MRSETLVMQIDEEKDRLLQSLGFDIDTLMNKAADCVVIDEPSAKQALSMALQARKLSNTLEASRKQITKPLLDYQRDINRLATNLDQCFEIIQNGIKGKIIDWMDTVKDDPFLSVDSLSVEDGTIYTKERFEIEIVDSEMIPREYMSVDTLKIKAAAEKGIRNIPGVKIEKITETQLRVKN